MTNEVLGAIRICATYADGAEVNFTLSVESEVCLGGSGGDFAAPAKWYPGVVVRGDADFAGHEDIREVVAYAINEGRVTSDHFDDDEGNRVDWEVPPDGRTVLRQFGIVE